MRVSHPTVPEPRRPLLTLRKLIKGLVLLIVLAVLAAAIALIVRPELTQKAAARLEARWGYVFREVDAGLMDKWSIALGVWLREARDGVPEIPALVIDVPFQEISKIYAKREDALARGILIQGPDDFVRGEIRVADRFVPVRLRLKGDWNDHLAGRKWSFRIHTRRGEELFGMRRFSIQNPNTRGYQSELMYFDVLSEFGVMTPRYRFVDVTLNGDSVGLMALEEFFSKELLEYRRRREGVIVRFDESYAWTSRDGITADPAGWGGAFDDYRNARVDAFGSTRVAESPTLAKQYAVAQGLLNGFADGQLPASDVFDVDQLGAFLAVTDMFGSWHAIAWHNMRWYLNPITLRLEPIGFDGTLQDRFDDDVSVVSDEPIAIAMLRDADVRQRYSAVLEQLQSMQRDGSLEARLRAVEDQYLPLLQTEFRMLGRFPTDYLGPRLDALVAASGGEPPAFFDPREQDQYPVLAHLSRDPVNSALLIESAVPRDVIVRDVYWVNAAGERQPAAAATSLPVTVPARGIGSPSELLRIPLLSEPEPVPAAVAETGTEAAEGWVLQAEAGLRGRDWSQAYAVTDAQLPLASRPLPAAADLSALDFLALDEDARVATVRPGNWRIDETLVMPAGWALHAAAGASLLFADEAALIVNGPLQLQGDSDQPVVLGPAGESWPGLVVMHAAEESLVRDVEFRSTHSVVTDTWTLTGGVNFYESDVRIERTVFRDSRGEDALNIIHSDFVLTDITVDGTASDAFDADFADGTVNGGEFRNVGRAGGGDAIDISGSEVKVAGTAFRQVSDKALSVGERSRMQATGVSMRDVGTAAAAKDGSVLTISDADIDAASFAGLTAYIKKPEYGPAEIVAEQIRMSNTETPTLVQTGSRVELDSVEAETTDVDVDALYETVMRPGLRR